ncbi:MAG: hypothetical protein ACMZ64_00620 [Oleiphilus sp.]
MTRLPDEKTDAELQQKKSDELSKKVKASMPTWAASLGVAAMIVVAMQLTFVFQPTLEETIDPELLSSLPSTLTEPHWVIQVAFEPSAKWSDISKTLESVNADIIRGPSNLGLIRAAIPKSNERFEEAQAVLGWLKTQTSIAHVALEED